MTSTPDSPSTEAAAVGGRLLVSRRTLLRGALGVAGLAAVPGLAACGSGGSKSSSGGAGGGSGAAASGTVTFGSNQSDAVPKAAYQAVFDAFTKKTGIKVNVNTVDHNTFQEQINSYLQGNPDDVFTWFAGYRMKFFAAQNLAAPIPAVWDKVGGSYSSALAEASTGQDGKKYFVPFDYYPWAFFYRKSVWKEKGYTPPKTLDELKTLGDQMKKDGLVPIAFADKDGWPAMGTFDYFNLRTNGYDFHVSLMAGNEDWTSSKVKAVFDNWKSVLPYNQDNALGRTWQEAAQSLQKKEAGMYLLGMFVGQQFQGADFEDLDFFPFPQIDPSYGTDTVEAPIDGFMMSKSPKNQAADEALLEYLASAEAQQIYLKTDSSVIGTNKNVDTSTYTSLQKKAVDFIGQAKHITQFMDRDTRPDFASTVMIPSLQDFLNNPNDIDGLVKKIQQQKQTIFTA